MEVRFGSPFQVATGPAADGLSTTLRIASRITSATLRPERADDLSIFDLIRDQIGIVETGIGDLASNPKHLEGSGR